MTIEDVVIRRRGEGNSRGVLLAGLFLGLVAAILIAVVLSRGGDDGAGGGNAGRMAVVATQDIPARTRLTRDMLELRTYEAGQVDTDAFTSASQLINRVTSVAVQAGQPILPAQVSTNSGEGLTFAVSEGMRAISISVSEVAIAGGNIAPGNYVDVVGVFEVDEGGDVGPIVAALTGEAHGPLIAPSASTLSFTLLQNLRVLAVAQALPDDVAKPGSETSGDGDLVLSSDESNPSADTVTLEVTQQQAQIIATGNLQGELRLSLRAFGDTTKSPVTPIIIPISD